MRDKITLAIAAAVNMMMYGGMCRMKNAMPIQITAKVIKIGWRTPF
jgi:hypothetical protein